MDYDLIVDLRTDGLACLLGGKARMTRWRSRGTARHAVQQHMSVIASLQPKGAIPETKIWLDKALRRDARKRLAGLPEGRCLALAPGAKWSGKIWPPEHYRDLVIALRDEFSAVMLLGGAEDVALASRVARDVPLACADLCGRTDLLQAAALLERAHAFVGNDSGLGHIAAAVGTPTLTVFGPGQPQRYHPWGERADWIAAPDACLTRLRAGPVCERLRAHMEKIGAP